MPITAALFDFGGVLTSSPFDAFARYEADEGLPTGFLRGLNATDPDTNAWARHERGEVGLEEFCDLYEAEAIAAGHRIDARRVLGLLAGELRPAVVEAVRRCHERLRTALLTNNVSAMAEGEGLWSAELAGLFDVVVESSAAGVRKPDPAFYALACERLGVEPSGAVFLDDLGVNLKPARALGMTTIKVVDPDQALAELEAAVGFPVRDE